MDSRRKQQERTVVKYFLERLEDAPRGKLVSAESPDFILRTSRKYAIGIELTQVVVDLSPMDLSEIGSLVREAMLKKEDKLKLYRKRRLDLYWLVITADSLDGVDRRKLTALFGRHDPAGSFHRVFLFDLFAGEIYPVK